MTEFNVDPMYIRRMEQELSTTKMTDDTSRWVTLTKWVDSKVENLEQALSRIEKDLATIKWQRDTLFERLETTRMLQGKIKELNKDG